MSNTEKQIYYRLIALWAVCEGVLGGLLHGIELPVTGFIVGGAAVIIITLIAYYVPLKGAIIRATLIVCIFKMMLSPQSPLPAYFAVLFQGLTGELFLFILPYLLRVPSKKIFKLTCILFSTLALAESGIQKILIMTLYLGKDFWVSLNAFVNSITQEEEVTNHSLYIAGGYVALHILEGIFLGIIAGRIPKGMERWKNDPSLQMQDVQLLPGDLAVKKKKKKVWKNIIFIVWILLLLLYLQSEFQIGKPLLPSDDILHILIRTALILLTWVFVVSPLLRSALRKWLQRQKTKNERTVNEILLLIPSTQHLVAKSWKFSGKKRDLQDSISF